MNTISFKKGVPVLFLLLAFLAGSAGPLAAEEQKLAVAPFEIKSDQDLSYLSKALMEMFLSRLYREGEVLVVDKGETLEAIGPKEGALSDEERGRLLKKLGGDYLLFGALSHSGKGVLLDTGLIRVQDPAKVMKFSAKSGEYETVDAVIGLVDRICADINEAVFGRARAGKDKPAPEKELYDVHAHPDKMLDLLEK